MDSANKYYSEGRYEKAISFYKRVLDKGLESSGIYYNLGNAYYKAHQLAPAILNYERARLRDPNNEDIQYNLQLARSQITDKIERIPEFFITRWINQLINLFSSDLWAMISMITFIAFLALFSVYLYSQRRGVKKSGFWIGLLALAIAVASFVFASQQKKEVVESEQAIVFAPKVTVKSSPAESGTDLFVIHEGTKVFINNNMGEWYEIRLSDGSQGWLRKKSVEPI
ncbi:MAG: tetratricopeptide repeat protein [Bacteroidales bacterium]|nr:tetratricopeptide repeat protein [Bacteroidales bacterium]